jgi:hypothetical protein
MWLLLEHQNSGIGATEVGDMIISNSSGDLWI